MHGNGCPTRRSRGCRGILVLVVPSALNDMTVGAYELAGTSKPRGSGRLVAGKLVPRPESWNTVLLACCVGSAAKPELLTSSAALILSACKRWQV